MVPSSQMQSFVDGLPESTFAAEISTPVGPLFTAASEQGLHCIFFDSQSREQQVQKILQTIPRKNTNLLRETQKQLKAYFAGRLTTFRLPLAPFGTEFQKKAWSQLQKIPYGTTTSYGLQALKMNMPKATRAVGSANGRNPLSIVVPCHRVIAKNGGLGGFAGGLDRKKFLLDLEQRKTQPH